MELIRHFSKLSKSDVTIAGGKGASLGEMTQAGIPVPEGFVVLSTTFDRFIEETHLDVELDAILDKVNYQEMQSIEDASEKIKGLILTAKMPKDLEKDIESNFKKLGAKFVAVRSSATSEDSSTAAWAGQLDSFLNTTESTLLENVKRCWASLFTPRAIFYREEKNLHHTKISVAVVVQKMVDSECSGIAFSVHPVTQDENQAIIEAGFGLGEAIVSGQITPDSYVMEKEPRRIIDKNLATQERGLYRVSTGGNEWRTIPEEKGAQQVLSDEEILELTALILKIEAHYGFPCDIEWAREKNKFYIVQSRPITTLTDKKKQKNLNKWAIIAKDFNSYYFRNSVWAKGINGARTILTFLTKDADSALAIEGVDGDIFYLYDKKKWADMHEQFTEKIDEDPNFLAKVIEETNDYCEKVNLEARKIFEKGFQNKTSKELIETLERMMGWQEKIYAYGVLLPLLDLAENAYVEEKTKNILKLKLKKQEVDKEFQVISYPDEETFAFKQEKDLLNLSQKFYENKELRALVLKNDGEGLIKIISKDYKEYFKLVQEHTKKHTWVYYSFMGPAYDEKKFLELIKNELSEKQTPEQKLKKILEDKARHTKEKEDLIKKLSLDAKEKRMLELAGTFVWAKPTRKDHQSQLDYYMIEGIIAEISRRTHIARKLLLSCPIEDLKSILNNKEFDLKKLESIFAHHIIVPDNNEFKLYYDDSIQEISPDIEQEHIEVESSHVIKGTVAMGGFGKGLARIINKSEDMVKMQKGDILISVATTPSIVPVMKLAAAIVTDEGGITCHAAIVSRELGTPCVIGTKNATRIIRDGDLIEVDANKGEVRIIKRAESSETSNNNTKINLIKMFTREHALFTFLSSWGVGAGKGKQSWIGIEPKLIVFLKENTSPKVSVWYNPVEFNELYSSTKQKIISDKTYFDKIKKEFYYYWNLILPLVKKKQPITLQKLKKIYPSLINWWTPMAVIYILPDIAEASKEIREEAEKIRNEFQEYADEMDSMFIRFFEKTYPNYKDLTYLITPEEVFSLESQELDKDKVNEIKARAKNYLTINDQVYSSEDSKRVLAGYEFNSANKIKLIKQQSREHSLAYFYVWQKANQEFSGEFFNNAKTLVFYNSGIGKRTEIYYDEKELQNIFDESGRRAEKDKTFFEKVKKEYYLYLNKNLPYIEGKKSAKNLKELEEMYSNWISWWVRMAIIFVLPESKTAPKNIAAEALRIRSETEKYSDEGDRTFIELFKKLKPKFKQYAELMTPEEIFDCDNLSSKQLETILNRNKGYIVLNGKISKENSLAEVLEKNNLYVPELEGEQTQILTGQTAHPGKVTGKVRIISSKNNLGKFVSGEILVAEMTSPDYVPVMKKALAIITDEGGKMCHAAIVARELKIPCVVGTKLATQLLHDGDLVEVDATKGEVRILEPAEIKDEPDYILGAQDYIYLGQWKTPLLAMSPWGDWGEGRIVKELGLDLLGKTVYLNGHYFILKEDVDKIHVAAGKKDFFNKFITKSKKESDYFYNLSKKLSVKKDLIKQFNEFFKAYHSLCAPWHMVFLAAEVVEEKLKSLSEKDKALGQTRYGRTATLVQEVKEIKKKLIKKDISLNLEAIKKKSPKIYKMIQDHIKKHSWYGTQHFIGQQYNEEMFMEQLNQQDFEKNKASKNPLVNLALDLAWIRLYVADSVSMAEFNLVGLLKKAAQELNLEYNEILLLTYEEMINSLENKQVLNREIIEKRKKGFGVYRQNKREVVIYNNQLSSMIDSWVPKIKETIELKGQIGCSGYVKGKVRILLDPHKIDTLEKGEILVAAETTPIFVPAMKRAIAIITDQGGITSHAAIVARELKKPCVIGTKVATRVLHDGDLVEVDANKGEVRIIKRAEEKIEPKENQNSDDPWILAQEITKMHILFFCMVHYMAKWWPKYKLTDNFKEIIAHFEGTHVKMYCKQSDYSKAAKDVADKILKDPSWALKQLNKIEELSDKFILNSNKLVSLKTSDLKELGKQFAKTSNYNLESQVFGAAFTWLTEARYELVTKRVIEIIQEQIKKNNPREDPIMVFNTLTKSEKKSHSFNEELDFLEVINNIRANPSIKNRFTEESEEKLLDYVLQKKDSTSKAINSLHDRWCWLSYGYTGPEKKLEEYIRDLKKAIKEGLDPKEVLKNNKSKDEELIKKQKEMVNRLKFNKDQMNLINFVKESSFIKDYRKGAVYHGMYSYKRFFDYVSKLTGIASDSFWHMNPFEIEALLEKNIRISPEEIKKRAERCTLIYKKDSAEFLFDEAEKKLLDRMVLETSKTDETELKGMPVSMGLVRGRAKLIESTDDLGKMNQGDILISHITYPNLVPAMKKAGAIVTNIGGVICHAAIIARELNIPCVVGTKFATKLIKDNDLVEVDANRGVITILERVK